MQARKRKAQGCSSCAKTAKDLWKWKLSISKIKVILSLSSGNRTYAHCSLESTQRGLKWCLIPKLGTYWLLSMKAHGMCTALLFSQREFGPVNSLRKEAISQWNSTGTPTRQVVELCRPSACSGHYLPNPLLGKKNIRIEVFCNSLCCSYFRWKTWNFYPTAALCLAVWSLCRLQLCWQGWPSNKAQINGTEGWTGAVITQTFPA